MTLARPLALCALLLAVLAVPQPARADFRGFARDMVRAQCGSDQHRVTARLAAYFKAQGVANPVPLLMREMTSRPRVMRRDDPKLRPNLLTELRRQDADVLYVFSKRYFNRIISSCELRVILTLKGDRLQGMTAFVFRHGF